MKLPLLLVSAWLGACAHVATPKTQRSQVSAIIKPAAAPNPLFESAVLGLRLRAPCTMAVIEREQTVPDGPVHIRGVACSDSTQEYDAIRFFRDGRDRAKDEAIVASFRKGLKSISREAQLTAGEWRGVELEGVSTDGQVLWMRTYLVGDGFWIVQVSRATGGLDRERARAFLDSVVLDQTWSVHAFPEGHLSVLLPDGAVRLGKKALKGDDYAVADGSWIGGSEARLFVVWSMPLEPGSVTPDERMDRVQESLKNRGNRLVWQAPIEFDGARGRDFLTQSTDSWMRLRIVLTDTDLYMLQATAHSKDALLDESVPRFLASLRWFAE